MQPSRPTRYGGSIQHLGYCNCFFCWAIPKKCLAVLIFVSMSSFSLDCHLEWWLSIQGNQMASKPAFWDQEGNEIHPYPSLPRGHGNHVDSWGTYDPNLSTKFFWFGPGFEIFPKWLVFSLFVENNTHGLKKLKTLCSLAWATMHHIPQTSPTHRKTHQATDLDWAHMVSNTTNKPQETKQPCSKIQPMFQYNF